MTLVSVVMPVLNGEKYLPAAIESILLQTLQDWEMIVVYERNTNLASLDILEYYSKLDQRIVLYENIEVSNIAGALNLGIRKSKGEYIVRMDADDVSLPQRLELQVDYLEKNPEISICGGNVRFIDEAGNAKRERDLFPQSHEEISADLLFYCCLRHPTIIFRRDVFLKYNLWYNNLFEATEDYELWCRASLYVRFANIPQTVLYYRWYEGNATHKKNDIGIQNYLAVMRENFSLLGITFTEEELHLLCPLVVSEMTKNNYKKCISILNSCETRITQANAEKELLAELALMKTLDKRFYWRKHPFRLFCAVRIRSIAQKFKDSPKYYKILNSLVNYLEMHGFWCCFKKALDEMGRLM